MSDLINQLNSRQLAKVLGILVAAIVIIFKLVIPKVKEKMARANEVKAIKKNKGADAVAQAYDALRNGDEQTAVALFEQGLGEGSDDLGAYKFLMDYYSNINQQYKALHWGRHAVEHTAYDTEIIEKMIALYQLSGDDERIDELQKLIK